MTLEATVAEIVRIAAHGQAITDFAVFTDPSNPDGPSQPKMFKTRWKLGDVTRICAMFIPPDVEEEWSKLLEPLQKLFEKASDPAAFERAALICSIPYILAGQIDANVVKSS